MSGDDGYMGQVYSASMTAEMKRNAARYAKQCETVREKGRKAARDGKSPDACPYRDVRKLDGRLTFSRHFRKLWFQGYRSETPVPRKVTLKSAP